MATRFSVACVIGMLIAAQALALDVTLTANGTVRFGDGPELLRPMASRVGWLGFDLVGKHEIKKPGVAPFTLDLKKKTVVDGVAKLAQLPDGKVRLSYTYTPAEDVELVLLGCTLAIPAAEMEGRPWRMDKRSGTFHHPEKGIHLLGGRGNSLEFPLGKTGRTLTFTAAEAQGFSIQDNRRWGGTYGLRLGATKQEKYAKGVKRTFTFTISADEPLTAKSQEPFVIAAGRDWLPLDYKKDIEAGSALDFSRMGFTDAPAGRHGWLKNVDGHFEFERLPGRPRRFYGVNLCGTANFPEHELAEQLVTRFKRFGYNTIRVHHHDAGTVQGSPDALTLNPENMDKLDYLLATAFREGFYVTTDLFVSRTRAIKWRHIGVDRDGLVEQHMFKALCAMYEPAFQNWCTYARNFLTHVNPYTGHAYKDEPGLPLISLINEGGLFMGWGRGTADEPIVREAWRKWVLEKRAADPEFYPDISPDATPKNSSYATHESAAFALFMGELEKKMVVRMKRFLRELGCKALLTNDNCGPHYAPLQDAAGEYDYVDDHFYVDHPHFLEQKWRLPSSCGNRNPIQIRRLPPCNIAFVRMLDKPYTVTEWNFSGPGMYRGVGGILTGAMAALQDWDGLWRFAYSHSREGLRAGTVGNPGYFNLCSDPLGMASDRASVCLFLRGDIAPIASTNGVALLITPESIKPKAGRFPAAPAWSDVAWNMRVGTCLSREAAGGLRVVPREQADDPAVTNWAISVPPTPALRFERERGAFAIDTPRTCGGFALDGTISAGPLSATLEGAAATVWASSLDDAPIAASKHILLTHLTDVQGDGVKFATEERKVLLRFGNRPLVRNGSARVELSVAEPGAFTVYELETSGRRLGKVPSEVRDGKLAFTASVAGPNGARILYEIVGD